MPPTIPSPSNRPELDAYFMEIASVVSKRATCPRLSVGCAVVKDSRVIATGYNGAVSGLEHCTDSRCIIHDGHCIRTVHAEVNAILQCAKHGMITSGATLYTTAFPCWPCTKLVLNAGITRIVYDTAYQPDLKVYDACNRLEVPLDCCDRF